MASDSFLASSRLDRIGAWLNYPAGSWQVVLLILALLALPRWLLSDQLDYCVLSGDDFAYVADARDWPRMLSNLFKPHNTHIVPLFRLWTFALVEASGRLSRLPDSLSWGSYFTFTIAVLLVGQLVFKATNRPVAGLAAMAILALSTVMEPVIVWYSAGQALCAGSAIVATLIALEGWLSRGGVWRLVLAAVSGIAAPLLWSGGLLAGPVATVYLWSRGKPQDRRAAVAILVLTGCLAGLLVRSVNRQIEQATESGPRRHGVMEKATQAARSTSIAIPEVLVLRNLGIDAALTGARAWCFACTGLVVAANRLRTSQQARSRRLGTRGGQLPHGLLLPGLHALRGYEAGWLVSRDPRDRCRPVRRRMLVQVPGRGRCRTARAVVGPDAA